MALSEQTKSRLKSVFRTPETCDEVIAAINEATSIETSEITNLAVTTAKLAADAVTTAKILNANVTLAKLAAGVVPSAPLTVAEPTDWSSTPTTIQEALDQLAARLKILEP